MQTNWPADLRPEVCPVYSFNELAMAVSPENVWPWLVRPQEWERYYFNARKVRFVSGGPELAVGDVFRWRTFGVTVETKIEELVPLERLAWSGTGLGARGYHAWIVERTLGGCRVITEETQRGFVPSVMRLAFRRMLLYGHQRWLEGLARIAQP